MTDIKQNLIKMALEDLYQLKNMRGEIYMTDAKQKLIEIIQKMDNNKIDILLEYACDLTNVCMDEGACRDLSSGGYKQKDTEGVIGNSKTGNASQSPLQLMDFEGDTQGLILLGHEEYETGEEFGDKKKIKLIDLIQNNTSKVIEFFVTINFYDDDDVNVGSTVEESPKIKPGKSWKMIKETYVSNFARKYDINVEQLW